LPPEVLPPIPTPAPAPTSRPRVFISHSSSDNGFGLRLAADLRQALGGDETSVWYDASGGLQGGDVWLEHITAELTSRDVFLLILSPAALSSRWVQDELRMAWNQKNAADGGGKVIIPVLYQTCAVPEYLATIQYVSFLPPRPYDEALAEVLAAIHAGQTRAVPLERQATTLLGPPNDVALLPAPERFVGRADDLAWVLGRLRAGGASALTALRGLPGIGKTTLAGAAVRQLQQEGRCPDGLAVVLCQGLTDPAEVLRRVLIRFDPLRRAPEATELPQLQDLAQGTLRGKRALVVLDNVEPELPVASVVAPLREAGLTVLLTARQTLPSAAVPADASRALELLRPEEALDLFAVALGRRGASALSLAERADAEQIVATLGRHTLAVNLAGAYAAAEGRDLAALARELADPAHGLALPGDDETPQAVRRTFARSLDSLPLEGRQLFAGLAAFATPECGRQATLALGRELGQAHPEMSVHLLVVRALAEPSVSEALPADSDRERLRLHPMLRAFAEGLFARWVEAEREAALLAVARHLSVYAEANQMRHMVLAADEGNLTGALEWAHARGHAELVADLAHGLREFWIDRGRLREGVRGLAWGTAAAAALVAQEEADAVALTRAAELSLAYGRILLYTGQGEAGEQTIQRSLEDFRAMGDRRREGMALNALGQVWLFRGSYEAAEESLQQALAIAREVGDRYGEGYSLANLGQLALGQGHYEAAEDYLRRSLVLARLVGYRLGEGAVLNLLGQVALLRGHYEAAEESMQQGLAIIREVGDRQSEALALGTLGAVALARGQYEAAEDYLRPALAITREGGARKTEGSVLAMLGEVALARGQREAAEDYLRQALAIARAVGAQQDEGGELGLLGKVALARGQNEEAEGFLRQALAIAREGDNRQGQGDALSLLGEVAVAQGRYEAGEEYLQQGLAIAREVGDQRGEARCLATLGRVAEAQGDLARAETLYRQSWALATEQGLGPESAEVQLALGRLLAERLNRREEGCPLILDAARHFAEMGMPEEQEARERAQRLGCSSA
jgi:tetratricopeptide (TPR) repeat protein